MGIIKMHKNVPDIYTTSRDFQVLLNMQSLVFSGNKFDVDTMEDITSTKNIRSSLLSLLAQKLGFFTNKSFSDEEIRQILIAFPYLLKNKGSLKAIEGAINTFLQIKHERSTFFVSFDRENYVVTISLNTLFVDTTILEEILKYILPVGWIYEIIFIKDFRSIDGATSYLEISKDVDNTNEIVLTTSNAIPGQPYDYVPTAMIRNSQLSTDATNLLIGAEDMGYIQNGEDQSTIYMIEGQGENS